MTTLIILFTVALEVLARAIGKNGFRKDRGTRDQIANIHWIIEKAREFQKKNIYIFFLDYTKVFHCVDHSKLWKMLKRWECHTTLPDS